MNWSLTTCTQAPKMTLKRAALKQKTPSRNTLSVRVQADRPTGKDVPVSAVQSEWGNAGGRRTSKQPSDAVMNGDVLCSVPVLGHQTCRWVPANYPSDKWNMLREFPTVKMFISWERRKYVWHTSLALWAIAAFNETGRGATYLSSYWLNTHDTSPPRKKPVTYLCSTRKPVLRYLRWIILL